MLGTLHRRSRRSAAFGGSLLAGSSDLKGLALKRRDGWSCLKSLNRRNRRNCR